MANKTITVLEADGVTQTNIEVLDVGRQGAAASKSVAMATEDKAVLDAISSSLTTIDGRVDGLETLITSTNTKLDTAITSLQIIDNMVLSAGTNNIGDVDVLTLPALPAGTNAIGKLAANAGVNIGEVSIASGSQNANGRASAANSTPTVLSTEDLAEITAIKTAAQSLDGGCSVFRSLDLDESEEEVKATAGVLHKLRLTNRTTSARYVKLYNATAASVTVGTTTPIDTIIIPGGESADKCTVITETFGTKGLTFTTALSMACTTGLADNDTGAPGANDVVATAYYK